MRSFKTIAMAMAFMSASASADWHTKVHEDPVTLEKRYVAISELTPLLKPNTSLLKKVRSVLKVACKKGDDQPIVLAEYNYNEFRGDDFWLGREMFTAESLRFDSNIIRMDIYKLRNEKLMFGNPDRMINLIKKKNKLTYGVNWRNRGKMYIQHDLKGAAAAIASIEKSCGIGE